MAERTPNALELMLIAADQSRRRLHKQEQAPEDALKAQSKEQLDALRARLAVHGREVTAEIPHSTPNKNGKPRSYNVYAWAILDRPVAIGDSKVLGSIRESFRTQPQAGYISNDNSIYLAMRNPNASDSFTRYHLTTEGPRNILGHELSPEELAEFNGLYKALITALPLPQVAPTQASSTAA